MFELPQLPDWNALHVLVIHFPIALLLLAAPALLGLALVIPKHSRQLAAAAGLMLVLGTGFCYVAQSTGDAALELAHAQGASEDEAIDATLDKHKHMAETATRYFTFFTAAFLAYLLVIGLRKEPLPVAANAALLALFLGVNAVLALGLGNAAHYGGRLVHEHGLLAPLEPGAGNAAAQAAGEFSGDAYPEHSVADADEEHDTADVEQAEDSDSGRGRGRGRGGD